MRSQYLVLILNIYPFMPAQPTRTRTHCRPGQNFKKSLLLFAALTGALVPWAKLFAQTATNAYVVGEVVNLSPFEVQATRLDPFLNASASSATKTQTLLIDVPQTVNVIPRELFALQGARSLEDALLNVAGVSPSVGDGQRDQVYIRGFSAQYDQYLDGVRDEAMYFRDLANVDRIEVVEGPSAVLYGHGSAGGLVNRISRQPTPAATGDISATYGSWNQRRVELDAGGPIGPDGVTYRFDAAGEASGGFRDQYFLRRYHGSPSAAWQVAPDTRILLQFDYLNDLRLDDLGIPALVGPSGSGFPGIAPAVPIGSYYGLPNSFDEDYVRAGVTTATAALDHTVSPSVSLHEVFRAEHYVLDRNNVLPTGVYLPAGGVYNGNLDAVWVKRSQRHICVLKTIWIRPDRRRRGRPRRQAPTTIF